MNNYKLAKITFFIFSFFILTQSNAQETASSPGEMSLAIKQRKALSDNSILKDYPVRSIGPVVQGARIVDIAVDPNDFNTFYVGYASGGVYKTSNNGVSFKPIFDNQGALTIGDMAIAKSNTNILYVGTGEKNSSRSSYAGSGMYKSLDGGKSWSQIGLDNTQHISRVVVHPNDPEMVWVASIGALYSKNKERGVFKSKDGGKTWQKTLFVNDSVGIIDLAINEQNPNLLIASSWERDRKAWDFKGNGIGSAIYRSEDGGETWTKSMDGIPEAKSNGRIGVNYAQGSPNIVYAVMDNQKETKEEKKSDEKGLKLKDFIDMSKADFLGLEDKKLGEFLKKSGYPSKYDAKTVKQEITDGKYLPKALTEYFGDANQALFDTKVTGAEVFRSEDGGKSWQKMNSYELPGVYFTYGYYFGEITVSPQNEDEIYIYGVPLLKSLDGGKTFARIDTMNDVHVDHHAMWVNPSNDDHVILGNDGGLYLSYDGGAEWLHLNNDAVGQFYTVNIDMEKPYNVYGGLQDNGTLMGSSKTVVGRSKNWEFLFGGDGMFVAPDPRNSQLVYAGFQFGNYFRLDRANKKNTYISPKHDIGKDKLRYNWRTPLILSQHNPDILYMGAQQVYRSINQGDSWDLISGDLTKNISNGNVPFSTISCLAESPHKFGVLYAGTDDGNIQLSKDGGGSWSLISKGLPQNKWVGNVFPSPHDEATVFVSLTGYRQDDFGTYAFMSKDYGASWTSLKGNLSDEPVNVLIQDPVNPNLLYIGTDHGTYLSLDMGKHWEHISQIPNVASYDMIVHPRENELVVATHGRSIYVLDVKPFQELKQGKVNQAIVAYKPKNMRYSKNWGEKRYPYLKTSVPSVDLNYYVGNTIEDLNITIFNSDNELVRELKGATTKGFHTLKWNLKISDQPINKRKKKSTAKTIYAKKGKYTIKFMTGNLKEEVEFEVK